MTDDGFSEACEGYDPKQVATELSRRGMLVRSESNRLKYKTKVPGHERMRLYAIKMEFVEGEADPETTEAEGPPEANPELPF